METGYVDKKSVKKTYLRLFVIWRCCITFGIKVEYYLLNLKTKITLKGGYIMALIKFPTRTMNTDSVNPFVNSIFDNFFNESFVSDRLVTRVPAVNITETSDAYSIELAAPGLKKEDFKINVDKDLITVSVEKTEESTEEDKVFSKKEYSYTSFSRSFSLPDTVDYNSIDANYEDGVLCLKIGKKEDAIVAKRMIEVK